MCASVCKQSDTSGTQLTKQWMFECVRVIFKDVPGMMCTQNANKPDNPSPALLSQLCTLVLQPVAL